MVFIRGKVLVIGDCAVGKTSICKTLCSENSKLSKSYESTIMTELFIKQIQLIESSDTVEMFLFDSSGKGSYLDNYKETWIHADMVCLVYDTKNQDSLDHMKFWYEKTLESFHHDRNIIGCIMANKSERNEYSSGLVNDATVKKISETFKMKHFECSAKENKNIIEPFKYLAGEYTKKYRVKCEQFDEILQKSNA